MKIKGNCLVAGCLLGLVSAPVAAAPIVTEPPRALWVTSVSLVDEVTLVAFGDPTLNSAGEVAVLALGAAPLGVVALRDSAQAPFWRATDLAFATTWGPPANRRLGFGDLGEFSAVLIGEAQNAGVPVPFFLTDQGVTIVATTASPITPSSTVQQLVNPITLPGGASLVRVTTTNANGLAEVEVVRLSTGGEISALWKTGDAIAATGSATIGAGAVPSGAARALSSSQSGVRLGAVVDVKLDGAGPAMSPGFVLGQASDPGGAAVLVGSDVAGSQWASLDLLSINNSESWILAGRRTGALQEPTTAVLSYRGDVLVDTRGGAVVDTVTLASTAAVVGLALNNRNHAVHAWLDQATDDTYVFHSCDAGDLSKSSLVMTTGTAVAFPDPPGGTWRVAGWDGDLAQDLRLADSGRVAVRLRVSDGVASERVAVVAATLTCCGNGDVDGGEQCDESGATANCDADCTLAVCGDGIVNPLAAEVCDTAGVVSAECDANCTAVACGDGDLNEAADEQCDDGNTNDDDGCSSACQIEPPTFPSGGGSRAKLRFEGSGNCSVQTRGITPRSRGVFWLLALVMGALSRRKR